MTTREKANVTYFHGENAYGCVEPFRWNPEFPITCDIDVPPDLVGQLTEFLTGLGIPFNPELQVSAVNRHPLHAAKFTGEDIPGLVDAINGHLSGRELHPLIPGNHEEWSVKKRHALLTMAAHHFSWADRQTGPSFWDEISPEGWQEIAKEYAIVFSNEPR